MGKIVEKKKKKKGRPSLLDLQKRNLREQQEQQQKRQQKRNGNTNSVPHTRDNYGTATPARRSARRNPNPDDDSPEKPSGEEDDDEDDESAGKRREKKLKLVLRLPPGQKPSGSLDSAGSDSDAGGETAAANGSRKRKINAISDGSGNKGDKSISGTNQSTAFQGASKLLDSGPSTPLPDKKLLLFVLDRLQKKDTYGVFSDPVDPEELPDYHEVIEHPMDFGTVRKKLSSGAYVNLEQFEKDVFLICSNAMQYNAPDTIYFRQARSIHELAKKNFENLRQDSDDNEPETKVVRRGRPPTKNLKKQIGRLSLESAGPEVSSDVALATAGENATYSNHDVGKASHLSDKAALADSSGRLLGLRNSDVYASWLADTKFERSDEFTGSGLRGNMKLGKKQVVHDESRRNTYTLSHLSAGAREPSVLMTFDGERKQLMPVGVLVEHGYARSLARFAANLGPVAWKVAAKKIERSLPPGVKYGPGWVGENDLPQRKMPMGNSSAPQQSPDLANSSDIATSCMVNPKVEISPEKPPGENLPQKHGPPSSTPATEGHNPSMSITNKSPEHITPKPEPLDGSGFSILNSCTAGLRPRPAFPAHQGPMVHPGMNGFNSFNLAAHMGKQSGSARPPGFHGQSSQTPEKGFKASNNNNNNNNNNTVHPEPKNTLSSEDTKKVRENRSTISARNSLPNRGNEAPAPPGYHSKPSWRQNHDPGLSPQQKPDSVPPDLNVRFQSPGSPSSSRVDSTQPDLALQL